MARMKIAKTLIVGALLCVPHWCWSVGLPRLPSLPLPFRRRHLMRTAPAGGGLENVVLAGGCFWGMQAVYEHTKGVTQAVSGYSGGSKETAHYEMVGTERTGHAESVSVTYDPRQISLGKILQIYFSVAHNPTELNYQGPDSGPSYRSAIFYANDEQKRIAAAYIEQLDKRMLSMRRS